MAGDPTPANGKYSSGGNNIGNSIADVTKYITSKLDEIIVQEAKTSGMTADPALVQATGTAGSVKLGTIETTGLGNYDKVKGYPVGQTTLTWQTYQLTNDRAIKIVIDNRDKQTTDGVITAAAVAAEEMRTKVVPEIDATRMAKLFYDVNAQNSANNNVTAEAKPTAANVISKIVAGIDNVAEATGIDTGLTVYVNGALRSLINNSSEVATRKDINNPSTEFNSRYLEINGNKLVFVPSSRMYTSITLKDGYTNVVPDDAAPNTLDPTKFGYAAGSYDIWFAVVAPGVANAITAINNTKVIPAAQSEMFDGDSYMFRIYHDLIVPKNKTVGAYISVKTGGAS